MKLIDSNCKLPQLLSEASRAWMPLMNQMNHNLWYEPRWSHQSPTYKDSIVLVTTSFKGAGSWVFSWLFWQIGDAKNYRQHHYQSLQYYCFFFYVFLTVSVSPCLSSYPTLDPKGVGAFRKMSTGDGSAELRAKARHPWSNGWAWSCHIFVYTIYGWHQMLLRCHGSCHILIYWRLNL